MKMRGIAVRTRESRTSISAQTLPQRRCFSVAQTAAALFSPAQIWTFRSRYDSADTRQFRSAVLRS